MRMIDRHYDAAFVGRVPIEGSASCFAIRLGEDGKGVSIHTGFLDRDGNSLLLCHSTGIGQGAADVVALLRLAVDDLERQLASPRPGAVQVRDVLMAHDRSPDDDA